MFKGALNPNVVRHIRSIRAGIPSRRQVPDEVYGPSADPNTGLAAGRIVGDYLAIDAPGVRRLARQAIAGTAAVVVLSLVIIGFALATTDGPLLVPAVLLLAYGIFVNRRALGQHRLLSANHWEEWPAAVLRVNALRFRDGAWVPAVMLFDFATGARHILMISTIGEGHGFYKLKGSILFCGKPEAGGLVYIPMGDKYYVAKGRVMGKGRESWIVQAQFDVQWPPGDPADWPTPHEAFKRDWPGAPKGYLSWD